jgi:murein DD-endopeptidase MepM/ murein hydrolase activator NlpD
LHSKFKVFVKFTIYLSILGYIFFYFGLYKYVIQSKPIILIKDEIHWNSKIPIKIIIHDKYGIEYYDISIYSGNKKIPIKVKKISKDSNKYLEFLLMSASNNILDRQDKKLTLKIKAVSSSGINFLNKNKNNLEKQIVLDMVKPNIKILASSGSILKGGSALVIFSVEDENIEKTYIQTNYNKKFKVIKYHKDNVFISLIAWPIDVKHTIFKLVSIDKAGNIAKEILPINNKIKFYKTSKIELKQSFLDTTVSNLFDKLTNNLNDFDNISKFIYINETIRKKNESFIHKHTTRVIENHFNNFDINAFEPLKRSTTVADFGEKREFYYQNEFKSSSFHLGLDIASIKHDNIYASNSAVLIDKKNNGIYGDMPILYFGLGLYGIYGHCSTINVKNGISIDDDEVIANTGKSGLVLGDHVHFATLVQGIEVRPNEWMNQHWIDANINKVIEKANLLLNID